MLLLTRALAAIEPGSPAERPLAVRKWRMTAGWRARIDWGRLVMVPGAVLVALIDLAQLTGRTGAGAAGLLRTAGTALTVLFYLLIIWCYLRRKRAVATTTSVTAHIAAVAATLGPLGFPLLPAATPPPGRQLAADLLLIAGLAWCLWALGALGPNLSVLAQARGLADRGPYRLVRHPLYTGELVSALGLAVVVGTPEAAAVWVGLCGLQVYRAVREEELLLRALPGYPAYRGRTAALVPGVF